jgi:hypothetical protein
MLAPCVPRVAAPFPRLTANEAVQKKKRKKGNGAFGVSRMGREGNKSETDAFSKPGGIGIYFSSVHPTRKPVGHVPV